MLNVDLETPRLITPALLEVIHGCNNTPNPDSPPLKNILERPHAELEDLQKAIFDAKQKRLKKNLESVKKKNLEKSNPYNFLTIDDFEEACSTGRSINDTMQEVRLFLVALIH